MDDFHLNYIAEYRNYKERNVSQAARAIINLFRDLNPDLLNKKYRGKPQKYENKEQKMDREEYRHLVQFGEMPV